MAVRPRNDDPYHHFCSSRFRGFDGVEFKFPTQAKEQRDWVDFAAELDSASLAKWLPGMVCRRRSEAAREFDDMLRALDASAACGVCISAPWRAMLWAISKSVDFFARCQRPSAK